MFYSGKISNGVRSEIEKCTKRKRLVCQLIRAQYAHSSSGSRRPTKTKLAPYHCIWECKSWVFVRTKNLCVVAKVQLVDAAERYFNSGTRLSHAVWARRVPRALELYPPTFSTLAQPPATLFSISEWHTHYILNIVISSATTSALAHAAQYHALHSIYVYSIHPETSLNHEISSFMTR